MKYFLLTLLSLSSITSLIASKPVVEVTNKIICQNRGDYPLDSLVIKPKVKFGTSQHWHVITTPGGVNPSKVVTDYSSNGTDWHFLCGLPNEDYYAGVYFLEFKVIDEITKDSASDTAQITVVTEPNIKITSPYPVCTNWDTLDLRNFVKLNDSKPEFYGSNSKYNFFKILAKNGNRNDPATAEKLTDGFKFSPRHFAAGNFQVKFSSNVTGCLNEDSFVINVNDKPDLTLLSPITICQGDILDLNTRIDVGNTKPSSGTIMWFGTNVSNGFFSAISKDSAMLEGPYKLRCNYTSNVGCTDTEYYNVTVRNKPEIQLIAGGNSRVCENTPISLITKFKYLNTISWQKNNGSDGVFLNNTGNSNTYYPGVKDAAVSYAWVRVSSTVKNECPMAEDSIQIFLEKYPVINFGNLIANCVPVEVGFNALETSGIAPGYLQWRWEFGNGDTSTVQNPNKIFYKNQGKYEVKLTVINTRANCVTTLSKPDFVTVYPRPVADFVSDQEYAVLGNASFNMMNKSKLDRTVFTNGWMNYLWKFNDPIYTTTDTSTAFEPVFTYSADTGKRKIMLVVESNEGCIDSAYYTITILQNEPAPLIPNFITPHGVGANTTLELKPNILRPRDYQMLIFDPSGKLVFKTTDVNVGWAGQTKGSFAPSGTYFYRIEYINTKGLKVTLKGKALLVY